MTDRPDPYRSVARELLCVLAEAGQPLTLRELAEPGRLEEAAAAFQLSVARVAGFVRTVPAVLGPDEPLPAVREPRYQPTTLGWMIARRTSRAGALARQLRAGDDAPWAPERPETPSAGAGTARARADAAIAAARAARRRVA